MPNVGKLTIDLEANTYTYTSALDKATADAKRAAGDIEGSLGKVNMSEARGSLMLLGDEIGIKLPRHVNSFIATLPGIATAMEMAFPFLAIAVGATVLFEHLSKLREEAEKLNTDTTHFDTVINNTFGDLDDKLLSAQKKADELRGDHLGALAKELELIDHQSMKEIIQSFEGISKAADALFSDLKAHWYEEGSGSTGAKHALEDFQSQYQLLISKGDKTGAQGLLTGTLNQAKEVLALQQQVNSFQSKQADGDEETDPAKVQSYTAAWQRLHDMKAGFAEKDIQSQQILVNALQAQVHVQDTINQLQQQNRDNAQTGEDNREADQAFRRMKQEEQQHQQEDRQREEAYREAVRTIQNGEKDKIEATKAGTAERLAAIDAAITEENHKGLQETSYYEELVRQRIAVIQQMAAEEARVRAEAGKIAAEHDSKMADLEAASEMEQLRHKQAMTKKFSEDDLQDAIETTDKEFEIKKQAIDKQLAALDQGDKDYTNKKQALQNKEEELEKEHQNKLTDIADKAEEQRNAKILAAERQFQNSIADGLTSVLMGHETFAKMMQSLGDQVVSGMLKNAMMSIMTNDMTKESDAAHAARKAFNAGMDFPFPVNVVMAPLLGAAAFTSVMAFEQGGIIPETAMALVHKNEMVLPANIAQHVMSTAGGRGEGGSSNHLVYSPNITGKYDEKELFGHFDRWQRRNFRRHGMKAN